MSALETASAVLQWARAPVGPPPPGDLLDLRSLLSVPADLIAEVGRLAANEAARLSLATPPFGDAPPPSLTALWLAAAIGGAGTPAALDLVSSFRSARTGWELVARHALVGPSLPHLPSLAEELLEVSPLTGLLTRPARGTDGAVIALAQRLLRNGGSQLLMHTLARPTDDPDVLAWRGRLLEVLRARPAMAGFVLDVYEAAFARYKGKLHAQILEVYRSLNSSDVTGRDLAMIKAVAQWWSPFGSLHRARHDDIRRRPYLKFDVYTPGLRLASDVAAMMRSS